MERPSTARLLAQSTQFSHLDYRYHSTNELNNFLMSHGAGHVPVKTNNVFEDVILQSTTDPALREYVTRGFGEGLCNFLLDTLKTLFDDPGSPAVVALKEKLGRTSLEVRQAIAEHVVLVAVGHDRHLEALELLDMTDTFVFDPTYPFRKGAAAKAAHIACNDLTANLNFFKYLSNNETLVIFCLCIVELTNRHPRNLTVIKELCDEIPYDAPDWYIYTFKYRSQDIIIDLLEGFDMNDPLHVQCRSEVQFAICMIDEAYGTNITSFIEKNKDEIEDTILDNMSYLMRSE